MNDRKTRPSVALRATNEKIDQLLGRETITSADVSGLNPREHQLFEHKVTQMLDQSTGTQRDALLAKIDPVLAPGTKNDIWENNHLLISNAIAGYMSQNDVMPTKNAIAAQTGLSRQTVAKHFKEYKSHPEFEAEMEQFKFMSHKVLAKVFKQAANGDIRAAKLYFEMVGTISKPAPVVSAQNNYIQINNTILSQENLKSLSPAQLQLIENIVTNKPVELPALSI